MKPQKLTRKQFLSSFALAALAVAALGGCNSGKNVGGDANTLTIISPHGREIQVEFERLFKVKHPDVKLKWIDQGGSSDDLQYVLSQFKNKQPNEGIGIDIFFGGGADSFQDMEAANALQPLPTDYTVPADHDGVPFRGKNNQWVAAALSSFGILYNKAIIERDSLPIPKTWADMGNAKLQNRVALADPRHSGSAHMACEIILQSNGWDKGWRILTSMAGNARTFGKSASGLLDQVASGEAVAAPAIDFYAASKIGTSGGKLSYVEPQGQRVVTADPIGILRGAPNQKLAQEFVATVLSTEGQKLWMLKKGAAGGPQYETLYRQPSVPALYKTKNPDSVIDVNPYEGKNNFKFDPAKSAVRRRALDDLIGAALIDNLSDVQSKWKKNPDQTASGYVPLSEAEFMKLAAKWNDNVFRIKTISEWNQKSRTFFRSS